MLSKRDHLIGILLSVAYLCFLLFTADQVGYSRDEGFYFTAARDYQPWFDVLMENPDLAVTRPVIDHHWKYNHEHPALMKVLFGFSNRLLHQKFEILSPSTSFRFPGMVTAALCLYLIYIWGAQVFDRRAGFYGALAFALMPRVFYHAHLACFDVAITSMWLLVTYLYWRSLNSWKFGLLAGLAFAISLCVKLNAFFLPFVLGFHYLVLAFAQRRARMAGNAPAECKPKPWAFVFGAVLAPPIFFGHWPWLWYDTINRVGSYLGFHSHHPHYNTAWFGENIIQAPTPIMFPTVMTLFTIPTIILVLFAVGTLIRARHHLPRHAADAVAPFWEKTGTPSTNGFDLLLLLSVAFPIGLISLPTVPIFGGTKHWMPAFPFIAMLAGLGASRFADALSTFSPFLRAKAVQFAIVLLLLLPPLQQTVTSHPFGLASYVPLIGGAPGAASLGMTRQFWGYTTAGVLPWLNERLPVNAKVNFHDTAYPSVLMFREEGALRRDLRITSVKQSTAALLHHELHMIRNEAWIWNRYGTFTPEHVLTYQGVPIVSVYVKPNSIGKKSSTK